MKLYQNISDFVTRSAYNVKRKKNLQTDTSSQEGRTILGVTYLRTVIVILSVGGAILVTVKIIMTIIGGT